MFGRKQILTFLIALGVMTHCRIWGAFFCLIRTLYGWNRRIDTSGTIEFTYINYGIPLAILLRIGHFTLFHEILFRLLLNNTFPELVEPSAWRISHVLGALILRHMLFDALSSIFCISRRINFARFWIVQGILDFGEMLLRGALDVDRYEWHRWTLIILILLFPITTIKFIIQIILFFQVLLNHSLLRLINHLLHVVIPTSIKLAVVGLITIYGEIVLFLLSVITLGSSIGQLTLPLIFVSHLEFFNNFFYEVSDLSL